MRRLCVAHRPVAAARSPARAHRRVTQVTSTPADIGCVAARFLDALHDSAPDTGDEDTQACLDDALLALEAFCTELRERER